MVDTLTGTQPDPIELTDFKGKTLVVPNGFPKELFDQSPEEFARFITVFPQKTSWGIGPLRKMPNYGKIIAEMQGKAAISIFYQHFIDESRALNAILNAHGGNNVTTWNNLYNNMYGPYEHLVHIE